MHAVDAVLGIHLALESWFPSPSESGFHIEYPSLLINNLSMDVLLEGVKEDPAGVLQKQRRVGQQQRLAARPRKREGGSNRGLRAGSHVCKIFLAQV